MNHPDGCNCHICVNVHGIRVDPTKLGNIDWPAFLAKAASRDAADAALTDASVEIQRLRAESHRLFLALAEKAAEVTHWRGSYENEFQTSRRCMDELTAMGKHNKELKDSIEGARESFENIAERLGPDTVHGGCKCKPGFMCVFCEAKEAANAMAYTLVGRRAEIGEDSPADIELARKAFGEGGT